MKNILTAALVLLLGASMPLLASAAPGDASDGRAIKGTVDQVSGTSVTVTESKSNTQRTYTADQADLTGIDVGDRVNVVPDRKNPSMAKNIVKLDEEDAGESTTETTTTETTTSGGV